MALLLLDINHFKEVNTTLGHAAGDESAARSSRPACGPVGDTATSCVVRLGGDEFAVLFAGADAQRPAAVERARLLAAEPGPAHRGGRRAAVGRGVDRGRRGRRPARST